jgi:ABC-2 type transport system permease protein
VNAFYWILRKNLAVFFSDRRGALMVLVVPVVLALLMGTIFNPGDGPSPIPLVVVDEDGGAGVAALIAHLAAEPSLKIEPKTATEAHDGVAAGEIGVAIRFAPGSSAKLKAASLFAGGDRDGLTLWVDPSRSTEADIVTGLLQKAMMETVFSQVTDPGQQRAFFDELRAGIGDTNTRPELAKFLDQGAAFADENAKSAAPAGSSTTGASASAGGSLRPPLDVHVEPVVAAGPTAGFNSFAHTFAGMLMQFLLFSASGHAKNLFAERAAGTLDRVRMTTARPAGILLGTAAAIAVICVISSIVVFGLGIAFAGIELRSGPLAFFVVVLGQAVFVGSFALLLAGLAHSDKQLDAVATLVVLLLCFVSGAWVPAFMLPGFVQSIGPLIPTRWILDGMAGATWRGLGLLHALKCAGVLSVFAAVFAAIGIRRFRWA